MKASTARCGRRAKLGFGQGAPQHPRTQYRAAPAPTTLASDAGLSDRLPRPPPWLRHSRRPRGIRSTGTLARCRQSTTCPWLRLDSRFPSVRALARARARRFRGRKVFPLIASSASFAVADLYALFSLVVLPRICFVVDLLAVVPLQFWSCGFVFFPSGLFFL